MATTPIVLLDSVDRYTALCSEFWDQTHHFTSRNECITFIQNRVLECKRLDIFLPADDRDLISTLLPTNEKIYFHLYCPTSESVTENERQFPQRSRIQIVEALDLWVSIGYVLLGNGLTRGLRTNNTSQTLLDIMRTTSTLLDEAEAVKGGEQPS